MSTNPREGLPRLQRVLETIATALVIVASSAVIMMTFRSWQRETPSTSAREAAHVAAPQSLQPLGQAAIVGSPSARIAVIEYSDFQCPYCGMFSHTTWPDLKRRYVDTGQVLVAFKHLPLSTHEFARVAADSADCARQQGRFWEMHDQLFDRQPHFDASIGSSIAHQLRLDEATFAQCIRGHGGTVERDVADARALGVSGTPTFLIGTVQSGRTVRVTHILHGTQLLSDFEAVFEEVDRAARQVWWRRILHV